MKIKLFAAIFLLVVYVGTCFGWGTLHSANPDIDNLNQVKAAIKAPLTKNYAPLRVSGRSQYSLIFDRYASPNGSPSKLNLLNFDELWVTYHSASNGQSCDFFGELQVIVSDFESETGNVPLNRTIYLSSGSRKALGSNVFLGDKTLPRTPNYLIRRQIGMQDSSWRIVEEGRKKVYMHTMRMDLREVSIIEFSMADDLDRVNFRLSSKSSGVPTDILVWDDIPKMEFLQNGARYVQMDLAGAIKKKWPEMLDGHQPLSLIEVIAFSRDDAILSNAIPISQINGYQRDVAMLRLKKSDAQSLSRSEYLGGGGWLWRMQLPPLDAPSFREGMLLKGEILSTQLGCIGNIEKIALVTIPPQEMKFIDAHSNHVTSSEKIITRVESEISWQGWMLSILVPFSILLFLFSRAAIENPVLLFIKSSLEIFHRNLEVFWRRLHEFFTANRRTLNIGFFLAVLIYAALPLANSPFKNYIHEQDFFAIFVLGAFVVAHEIRWRMGALGRASSIFNVRVFIGNKWPPLIIWILSALFVFVMVLMQWGVYSTSIDKQQILFSLNESSVLEKIEISILWCALRLLERGLNIPVTLAIFYGFLPWIWWYLCVNLFPRSAFFLSSMRGSLLNWRWAVISLIFYVCGFLSIGQSRENYFFSLGGLALVALLSDMAKSRINYFQDKLPSVDLLKYTSGGLIYFVFALIGIATLELLKILEFTLMSDIVATVVFYCLVVGALLEISSWKRTRPLGDDENI